MTPHKTSPPSSTTRESKPDNCLEVQRFGDPFCESSLRLTPTQSQQKRSRSISGPGLKGRPGLELRGTGACLAAGGEINCHHSLQGCYRFDSGLIRARRASTFDIW
ncbi:hypothetical protein CDAR_456891 [Caerostris darwini]|uniref:Uncharacterized protein n=1 Tax=Caerostris darwini TaxID=1538125 RepID=A0AAV4T191_9ARAC|nr:hypothetical protein CDAR_456891 [Caerostris darwini]